MADPESIYNWLRLDDRITTSGQPTAEQLAEVRALGVRHVVNLELHSHERASPDEAASVGRLGMSYVHIPVDFGNPTEEDFNRFRVLEVMVRRPASAKPHRLRANVGSPEAPGHPGCLTPRRRARMGAAE